MNETLISPARFTRSASALRQHFEKFMCAAASLGPLDEFKNLLDEISILDTYGVDAYDAWGRLRKLPRWRWLARWWWVRRLLSLMSSTAVHT